MSEFGVLCPYLNWDANFACVWIGVCLYLDRESIQPVSGFTPFLSQCGEFACLCSCHDGKIASVWMGNFQCLNGKFACVCRRGSRLFFQLGGGG